MDAAFPLAGLIGELAELIEAGDFEGAEELLAAAVARMPEFESFFHLQLGRLYVKWNKLTSAVNHLNRAAELAHAAKDQVLFAQIVEALAAARRARIQQAP